MTAIKRLSHIVLTALILILYMAACLPRTIKIGFVADLTGSNSALGVDGRDGAQLAVDQINAQGGVAGQKIQMIARDDLGTSEGAIQADRELIQEEGIQIIAGHMTSGPMIAAWEQFKDSGALFVSPTSSTPILAGIDDNFLRLIVVNSYVAERIARYAFDDLGLRRIAIFSDDDNAAFTQTYQETFGNSFRQKGGEIVFLHEYSSKTEPSFLAELNAAKEKNPDGLFIAASAFDTALIAQRAQMIGLDVRLFTTNWAFTSDLLENGGSAVEGMMAVVSHEENSQSPAYLEFEKKFLQRYGRKPTFASIYGYETIMMLASALEQTSGKSEGLKSALLKTSIQGLNGKISFDAYGDVTRALYLITVHDGKFVTTDIFPAP